MAFQHALSTNNYGPAKLIVATSAGSGVANGTHATLASAMADAVSGDTIFLRDSVTENVTLTAGVNITAWQGGTLNTPTINGTLSMTTAGTCNINGIRLASSGAEFLSVTGSAASIVNLNDCYLTTAFDPGITFSSSSPSATISINYCQGDITASAKKYFAHSSAGILNFNFCFITNSGSSTTASTVSAGNIALRSTEIFFPITTSSTGIITANRTSFNCGLINSTAVTSSGGVSTITSSEFGGGSSSALSVGGTLVLTQSTISSSNTNAITGAGTLSYAGLFFSGSSYKINTTTQVGGTIQGGVFQAPSVGFIGERIENTATSVSMTSTVAKTITSIALTPGIWDISGIATTIATGGTTLATVLVVNISTTDNTIVGTAGIQSFQTNNATGQAITSGSVPAYRVTLTANATYYLVCNVFYSSTTAPTTGRLSATRVG